MEEETLIQKNNLLNKIYAFLGLTIIFALPSACFFILLQQLPAGYQNNPDYSKIDHFVNYNSIIPQLILYAGIFYAIIGIPYGIKLLKKISKINLFQTNRILVILVYVALIILFYDILQILPLLILSANI